MCQNGRRGQRAVLGVDANCARSARYHAMRGRVEGRGHTLLVSHAFRLFRRAELALVLATVELHADRQRQATYQHHGGTKSEYEFSLRYWKFSCIIYVLNKKYDNIHQVRRTFLVCEIVCGLSGKSVFRMQLTTVKLLGYRLECVVFTILTHSDLTHITNRRILRSSV